MQFSYELPEYYIRIQDYLISSYTSIDALRLSRYFDLSPRFSGHLCLTSMLLHGTRLGSTMF